METMLIDGLHQLGTLEFWEALLEGFEGLGPLVPILLAMLESIFPPLPLIAIVALNVAALGGTAYISAVSRKLMPRSSACCKIACASLSLTCSPKVMVPRQMAGTVKPDCPKGRCGSSSFCIGGNYKR